MAERFAESERKNCLIFDLSPNLRLSESLSEKQIQKVNMTQCNRTVARVTVMWESMLLLGSEYSTVA